MNIRGYILGIGLLFLVGCQNGIGDPKKGQSATVDPGDAVTVTGTDKSGAQVPIDMSVQQNLTAPETNSLPAQPVPSTADLFEFLRTSGGCVTLSCGAGVCGWTSEPGTVTGNICVSGCGCTSCTLENQKLVRCL